jgi:hypothetical protein
LFFRVSPADPNCMRYALKAPRAIWSAQMKSCDAPPMNDEFRRSPVPEAAACVGRDRVTAACLDEATACPLQHWQRSTVGLEELGVNRGAVDRGRVRWRSAQNHGHQVGTVRLKGNGGRNADPGDAHFGRIRGEAHFLGR